MISAMVDNRLVDYTRPFPPVDLGDLNLKATLGGITFDIPAVHAHLMGSCGLRCDVKVSDDILDRLTLAELEETFKKDSEGIKGLTTTLSEYAPKVQVMLLGDTVISLENRRGTLYLFILNK
jgi:hypothetical protein